MTSGGTERVSHVPEVSYIIHSRAEMTDMGSLVPELST